MYLLRSLKPARALAVRAARPTLGQRTYADLKMRHPGPPPLPAEDQAEFEALQMQAEKRARVLNRHPAAPERYEEFEGNVNPVTGEVGGPKQDPLRHGDYSFNGRVTDF